MNAYRIMQNMHALKSYLKNPLIPSIRTAIGSNEVLHSVPVMVFTQQHLPLKAPIVNYSIATPYEKTALKFSNDTLSTEDFPTDSFYLGDVY